jgi:hypothetical protein
LAMSCYLHRIVILTGDVVCYSHTIIVATSVQEQQSALSL